MLTSASSLTLPESIKLKGEENWTQWKDKITSIAKMNSLYKYVYEKAQNLKPNAVNEYDSDLKATPEQLKAWKEWEQGDATMQLAITCNCKTIPAQLI